MTTHLIGRGVDIGPAHQPASAATSNFWSFFKAIGGAFDGAVAAQHVYEGLLAQDVPSDQAARRTFETLYGTSSR
ncbi:MAG: hypothetical protein KDJ47_07535 [Hyphomicrobiaceae bacterium]|nr:hypothetical protein [Hyphomicrobiaceae bacterium]